MQKSIDLQMQRDRQKAVVKVQAKSTGREPIKVGNWQVCRCAEARCPKGQAQKTDRRSQGRMEGVKKDQLSVQQPAPRRLHGCSPAVASISNTSDHSEYRSMPTNPLRLTEELRAGGLLNHSGSCR